VREKRAERLGGGVGGFGMVGVEQHLRHRCAQVPAAWTAWPSRHGRSGCAASCPPG
jgi:hypothetical protein